MAPTITWRRIGISVLLCSIILIGLGTYLRWQALGSTPPNLLLNGSFDTLPFYGPLYPNHRVAGGWYRWWIHGTILPEFDDVNTPTCTRCVYYVDGGHAQVYFKWGDHYTAGIYQVVPNLVPCRPYELTMHARTHSLPGAYPHARIGLDPLGADLTSGPTLDERGAVHDQAPLNRAAWSREQTVLFIWEKLSVTAEPVGSKLTAILYAAPRPGSDQVHFYDTYWDAGSLHPVSYPNGRLPIPNSGPSDSVFNVVTTTNASTVTITWKTQALATSQVWYEFFTPSTPTPPVYAHNVYFPLVAQTSFRYSHATQAKLDTAVRDHSAVISDIPTGQSVRFIVLARHVNDTGTACVTSYAGPFEIAP